MTVIEAVEMVKLIEDIRNESEGASVRILCPNPGDNDQPAHVIEVNSGWTNWLDRRFGGDTLLDALRSARQSMPSENKHRPITGCNEQGSLILLSPNHELSFATMYMGQPKREIDLTTTGLIEDARGDEFEPR